MQGSDFPLLGIVFADRLTLGVVPSLTGDMITVSGTAYRLVSNRETHGFYDWLLQSNGRLLGVRFCPFGPEAESLYDDPSVIERSYVRRTGPRPLFTIDFAGEQSIDAELAVEQEFGKNWIARSSDGQYLVTFGTRALTVAQVEELSRRDIK
jgi:hypothetical protein